MADEVIDKYQDNNGTGFPDPRIDVHMRDKEFHKRCVDYAVQLHFQRRAQIDRITQSKNSYNGISPKNKYDFLDKMYNNKQNKARYVDYRLSRRAITRILGEWLERPLNATVYTVNSSARLKKVEAQDVKLGMTNPMVKKNVQKLRDNQIVDPFDGMEFDDKQAAAPTVFSQMTDKSRNEMIMQLLLNDDIQKKGLKDKLYFNLQDVLLGSEAYGKAYIRKDGREDYRPIDIRRRISLESEGDPYGERSPYKGEERPMYIHEILQEFPGLSDKDIITIKGWEGKDSSPYVSQHANYFTMVDSKLMVNTFTLQWIMFLPFKRKIYPDGKKADISNEYLLDSDNRKKLRQGEQKGEYKIDVKWKQIKHQCTKIGPDVYTEWGRCAGEIGSIEKPFETKFDYIELLFDTVAGIRISLVQQLEEIKEQYNVVRLMLNREIVKFKGMQFRYDRALLPKVAQTEGAVTMQQIVYQMVNDGWMDYNSAADGNMGGESKDPKDALTTQDLGLSASVPTLINIALDLEQLSDRIAGFNAERTGETPASSTATNATNNLISSRSITAPINYFFDRFCEQVMLRMIELKKISYGVLHKDEGELLLGDEAVGFLQVTKDIADDDYHAFLSDGRREEAIRNRMGVRMDQAVNAGEMRISDAYAAEMADTLAEAQAILEKGWKEIQAEAMKAQAEKTKQIQMQMQGKGQLMHEDREDKQKAAADLAVLTSDLKRGENSTDALNQYILNERQFEQQAAMAEQTQ